MTFTIEPMINLGSHEVEVLEDDWTAVTVDGSLSAQFEHTVLVHGDGLRGPHPAPGSLENSEIFPEYWAK
jgi:methionyl aminopeptidase